MSYLTRIAELNQGHADGLIEFYVDGRLLGHLHHEFADALIQAGGIFVRRDRTLALSPALERAAESVRSAAIAPVLARLRDAQLITGWRDELFPLIRQFGEPPAILIERAAIPNFGARGFGVHVNGFTRTETGLELWVARRSRSKPTWPGLLDQLVAGGQPAGLGIAANVIKECGEEAGIHPELARRAHAAGTVSYCMQTQAGIRPDLLFVFDLELPADFRPVNTDGEVESFERWPIDQVAAVVSTTNEFKPNCALVVIDFLVRHGVIGPDHPDYELIVRGLRAPPPSG